MIDLWSKWRTCSSYLSPSGGKISGSCLMRNEHNSQSRRGNLRIYQTGVHSGFLCFSPYNIFSFTHLLLASFIPTFVLSCAFWVIQNKKQAMIQWYGIYMWYFIGKGPIWLKWSYCQGRVVWAISKHLRSIPSPTVENSLRNRFLNLKNEKSENFKMWRNHNFNIS